jgi:putative acetyltransferase
MINIRRASLENIEELRELYFNTITSVNSKDYNKEQIEAWASTSNRTSSLREKIQEQNFYVAENKEGQIIGFASLENSGYIDMMYVHKDFQNKGVAKALLNVILEKAKSLHLTILETEASKTAKSFFAKHGFETILEQTVYINNVELTNYKMTRILL